MSAAVFLISNGMRLFYIHLFEHCAFLLNLLYLKLDYTRDRNGGQLPSSPVSSTTGCGSGNGANSIRSKSTCGSYVIKTNKLCDSPNGVLNLSKQQSSGVTTNRSSTHSMRYRLPYIKSLKF